MARNVTHPTFDQKTLERTFAESSCVYRLILLWSFGTFGGVLQAEDVTRRRLGLRVSHNLRVRAMHGGKALVEVRAKLCRHPHVLPSGEIALGTPRVYEGRARYGDTILLCSGHELSYA